MTTSSGGLWRHQKYYSKSLMRCRSNKGKGKLGGLFHEISKYGIEISQELLQLEVEVSRRRWSCTKTLVCNDNTLISSPAVIALHNQMILNQVLLHVALWQIHTQFLFPHWKHSPKTGTCSKWTTRQSFLFPFQNLTILADEGPHRSLFFPSRFTSRLAKMWKSQCLLYIPAALSTVATQFSDAKCLALRNRRLLTPVFQRWPK